MSDVSTLRRCGMAGLSGTALLLAADWVLLGTWTSGRDFQETWYVLLSEMPRWRLTVGGLAGPIGAWLCMVGFWQLTLALQPAGRRFAFVVFAGFSMSYLWVAGAFHTSFPYLADAWRAREAAGEEATAVRAAMDDTFAYTGLVYYGGLFPAAVGTLLLAAVVLRGRSRYPRWFAALNPGLLYALTMLFQFVPAPLGGLLVIGAGNLVFLVFFGVSTALLWNGGREMV